MKRIKVGIAGSAGYTGGELLRLLLLHPSAEVVSVQSKSQAGKRIYEIHTDLLGETNMVFSEKVKDDVDVLFLCMGHHEAKKYLELNSFTENIVIIDLSQDFRLNGSNTFGNRKFVYGLPELNRERIKKARNIANPGCFATCIQLALLPVAAKCLLQSNIHINAVTGSTGAGQTLSATSHYSWRFGNHSVYKAFTHQHLDEIGESIIQLQPEFKGEIQFIPQRGGFTRGIFASVYFDCDFVHKDIQKIYNDYYSSHPFINISEQEIDVKQVANTNRCFLHIQKHKGSLLVTAVIDNLLKGASGQAVQNMNLIFGLEETTGLHLKPSAF